MRRVGTGARRGAPPEYDHDHLVADLRTLGLPAGRDVLVHCSLRSVGRVDGGAATVLAALRTVLGPDGTVMVVTHTASNSHSSPAYRTRTAGMDPVQRAAFEAAMPGFDPASTPSEGMGVLAEYVRRHPEAVRSRHPQTSFAALGARAGALTADHALNSHLGERSPLAALYRTDGYVLLLGLDYSACTALHLAEYRLPRAIVWRPYRCYVMDRGARVQLDFLAPHLNDSDFPPLGSELDGQPFVRIGMVGAARSRLLPMRATVDFATGWIAAHRTPPANWLDLPQRPTLIE